MKNVGASLEFLFGFIVIAAMSASGGYIFAKMMEELTGFDSNVLFQVVYVVSGTVFFYVFTNGFGGNDDDQGNKEMELAKIPKKDNRDGNR